MIEITKDEASYIRKVLPNANVYKTMKQSGSKRGSYFCEETTAVKKALSKFEGSGKVIETYPPIND